MGTILGRNLKVDSGVNVPGDLIEDADILMASIAIVENLVLVTNNIKHFDRIESLATENWLED